MLADLNRLILLGPGDGGNVDTGVAPLEDFVNDVFLPTALTFSLLGIGVVAVVAAIDTPLALKTCSPLLTLTFSFACESDFESLSSLSLLFSLLDLCLLLLLCLLLCLLCLEVFPSMSGVLTSSGVSVSFFVLLMLLWW